MDNDIEIIDTTTIGNSFKERVMQNRSDFYRNQNKLYNFSVSIFVFGYNRCEKTRQCVESIINYSKDINYELILIDNGSTDETLSYFMSIRYPYKKIIQVTKNIGGVYGIYLSMQEFRGKYFVLLANDIIVTRNWLSNLLNCMESNPKVGYVVPLSSNVSNLQEINFGFTNLDEMQKKASVFNKSNPLKWQERLRLINVITVLRKEVIDNVGLFDVGFFHDFGEDDYSARVRRAGYKLMLCGDTFVHHDHDFRNMEDKDPIQFQKSLEAGRKNYKEKYFGIDAWDDINNYELTMMNLLSQKRNFPNHPSILGIDVRCGTPILQVRNVLRSNGIFESDSAAFTTDAKYFLDLQCVTEGHAVCDRIEYLYEHFAPESFDYVVLGEPINTYPEPIRVAENILRLVRKGGKALLKLRNTASVQSLLYMIGLQPRVDENMPVNITMEDFKNCLTMMGVKQITSANETFPIPQDTKKELIRAMTASGICNNPQKTVDKMSICDYVFMIDR